jgi:hypothetical protein
LSALPLANVICRELGDQKEPLCHLAAERCLEGANMFLYSVYLDLRERVIKGDELEKFIRWTQKCRIVLRVSGRQRGTEI